MTHLSQSDTEDISANNPNPASDPLADYCRRIEAIITDHRGIHRHYVREANDRNLTQEYRTWHHIKAQTLGALLDELESIRPGQVNEYDDLGDNALIELLQRPRRDRKVRR